MDHVRLSPAPISSLIYIYERKLPCVDSFHPPALIPLDEFEDMNLTVRYGITPDGEVLDILHTASETKGVLLYTRSGP